MTHAFAQKAGLVGEMVEYGGIRSCITRNSNVYVYECPHTVKDYGIKQNADDTNVVDLNVLSQSFIGHLKRSTVVRVDQWYPHSLHQKYSAAGG